jgi:hypothetical protein
MSSLYIVSGEARGFRVGVKGEGTGGGVPPPAGGLGAVPRKKFQITDARRRVLAHFSDKVNTLIPAFIPVNFGKVPNPFDF